MFCYIQLKTNKNILLSLKWMPNKDTVTQHSVPVGARLPGIENFDHDFWNISNLNALCLDPQTRLSIQTCHKLLEKTAYLNRRRLLNIGVFAG